MHAIFLPLFGFMVPTIHVKQVPNIMLVEAKFHISKSWNLDEVQRSILDIFAHSKQLGVDQRQSSIWLEVAKKGLGCELQWEE